LALVATTPLRQDGSAPPGRGCSSCSPLLCCSGEGNCQKCGVGENPPTQVTFSFVSFYHFQFFEEKERNAWG